MRSSRSALALFFLVLSACSPEVNLGGPQNGDANDAGDPSASSGGDASDSSASSGGDASAPANDAAASSATPDANVDAGPLGDLNQAETYAAGDVPCTTAADCCVAFEGCLNLGLVVGSADEQTVATLLMNYDVAEYATPDPKCTGCIPPPVQVACIQKKCAGTVVGQGDLLPDGALVDPSFSTNHCGTLPGAPATFDAGQSILGC